MTTGFDKDIEKDTAKAARHIVEKCDTCGKEITNTETRHHFSIQCRDAENGETSVEYSVCSFECYIQLLKLSAHVLESQNALIDGMKMPFIKKVLEFYNA